MAFSFTYQGNSTSKFPGLYKGGAPPAYKNAKVPRVSVKEKDNHSLHQDITKYASSSTPVSPRTAALSKDGKFKNRSSFTVEEFSQDAFQDLDRTRSSLDLADLERKLVTNDSHVVNRSRGLSTSQENQPMPPPTSTPYKAQDETIHETVSRKTSTSSSSSRSRGSLNLHNTHVPKARQSIIHDTAIKSIKQQVPPMLVKSKSFRAQDLTRRGSGAQTRRSQVHLNLHQSHTQTHTHTHTHPTSLLSTGESPHSNLSSGRVSPLSHAQNSTDFMHQYTEAEALQDRHEAQDDHFEAYRENMSKDLTEVEFDLGMAVDAKEEKDFLKSYTHRMQRLVNEESNNRKTQSEPNAEVPTPHSHPLRHISSGDECTCELEDIVHELHDLEISVSGASPRTQPGKRKDPRNFSPRPDDTHTPPRLQVKRGELTRSVSAADGFFGHGSETHLSGMGETDSFETYISAPGTRRVSKIRVQRNDMYVYRARDRGLATNDEDDEFRDVIRM